MEKVIVNNNGVTKEYEILFTFFYNDKKYITYTNYEKDEKGNLICLSSLQENEQLLPINDEKALDIIDEMLRTLTNAVKI